MKLSVTPERTAVALSVRELRQLSTMLDNGYEPVVSSLRLVVRVEDNADHYADMPKLSDAELADKLAAALRALRVKIRKAGVSV